MVAPGERIHVIGIAGSGAAGAALLLQRAGALVDGCDVEPTSPYTPPLAADGIRVLDRHDPAHLAGVDRVAITPALRAVPDHPELAAATAAGLPVVTWQALLGEMMATPGRIGIGVTGTHGKSTTTALLGHLLITAGLDPTVEVGAFIEGWGASVHAGEGSPFVVEADEFGDNFLNYHPAAAIVTNIEMDHPDYFADAAAVMGSFERFVRGMAGHDALGGRLLIIAADDPGATELTRRLEGWEGRLVAYGRGGDVEATEIVLDRTGSSFDLLGRRWRTSLAGLHNVANATAALVVAHELGADPRRLDDGLRTFAGAGRRMQLIVDTPRVTIYDDYGHHPTEVRAALAAARQKVGPDRRLWAIFEPHMYSRTALLMDAFSTAFADANEVVVADIFASRDTPEAMRATSAEDLADAIERASGIPAMATGDVDTTTQYVADHLADGDAVLVMGAGKSYRIAAGLAARLGDGAAS
ncbi:MAG TPA: UDP-N-acetylmuramate--L-alanine ligase [Candidatus Limnocylindria bacterium]